MKRFARFICAMNDRIGKVACLLILPMAAVVVYEVFMRRVLNMPTSWAFEMTVYIYGAHFMFGMAPALLYDRHVRIDIIVLQMPQKVQLWLRLLTFCFIFVPFVGAFTYAATEYAAHSWAVGEHSWSAWKPPLYPYKTIMPVTMFLLLLQGIATFVREYYELKGEKL
ncbi:MAG: TRAP transporter small permease subunit [Desulfobacteraceae bacterium]|nr:MAG: TRAP transporter small permease subunit [Desulfobacteraceae bacterium]